MNTLQGLKALGDRASGVSGFPTQIGSMAVDDRTAGFAATDTAHNTGGAPTNFLGNALDSTPTGGAAASPYVVSHVMTLTTAQFNTFVVKRIALHNKATAPLVGDTTLAFGIDGLSLTKASTFALVTTFRLSYT